MFQEQFIFIQETGSTNEYMKRLFSVEMTKKSFPKDFTVVHTDFQTAGKGLANNSWHSEIGENILASFFFNSGIKPEEQFYFNIFFSLSVKKMLNQYTNAVRIKWPNDIYIHNKKIAGILIEHTIEGEKLKHSIAGVGINLNQTDFASSVINPTSLKLETGSHYDRLKLIKELITKAKPYYELLQRKEFNALHNEYYQHLYQFEEYHTYQILGKTTIAKIIGTNKFGQLLLQKKDGETYTCGYKEVKYIL